MAVSDLSVELLLKKGVKMEGTWDRLNGQSVETTVDVPKSQRRGKKQERGEKVREQDDLERVNLPKGRCFLEVEGDVNW